MTFAIPEIRQDYLEDPEKRTATNEHEAARMIYLHSCAFVSIRGFPLSLGCGLAHPECARAFVVNPAFRRGFSFVEILFSIMILGIGFIMIAAIFPAALRQTQSSSEETVASTIAREGAAAMANIAGTRDYAAPVVLPATNPPTPPLTFLPPTNLQGPGLGIGVVESAQTVAASGNKVYPTYTSNFWAALSGDLILPSDPRYAWVPMYRRDFGSAYAQVIVIACQVRNASQYNQDTRSGSTPFNTDLLSNGISPSAAPPNLQARPVMVTLNRSLNITQPDTMSFAPAPNSPDFTPAVAEGSFVVIADDRSGLNPPAPQLPQTANGFIYRVGNPRPGQPPNNWELQPGNDTKASSYVPTGPVLAYIVGRRYDPSFTGAGTPIFSGPAQDVAVYTTFVKAN